MEFGKYRLVRKLATGGMAEIFLARQEGMEGFEKTLVIKRILPIHADNGELIDMFLDEARIAATLNHPNIVQIFDLGKCDDEYFIAMEHIHGQDLRRICERGLAVGNFLPVRHAVRIIADAAAGLHYAHNQLDSAGEPLNIVHRDISPQNIVVSFDGVVKILDFGIAKAANKIVTTRHGQLKGKYAYMSPEQCNGLEVDHRSDIFSLGTLLYEVTVCTRLFKGDTDIQTIKRVSEAVVPLPTEVRSGFPVDLERILLKSLTKDPHDRYQSGRAFQEDLEEFLSSNRMKTGPVQLGNYMREIFPDKLEMPDADPDLAAKEARKPGRKMKMAPAPEDENTNLMPPEPEAPVVVVPAPAPDREAMRPPETVQLPEIQARPLLEDPNRVPPSVVETDPGLPPAPGQKPLREAVRHARSQPAPQPAPQAAPAPSADQSGDHVSFVVSPDAPFATGEVTEFKKKQRKVSRSSVKTVEYRLRSNDEEELDSFERGSRFYYYILALVVLPMLGFGAFLLYSQGNFFASSDMLSHTGAGDKPDVGVEAPPPPLETVLLNLTTDPPGAAVAINGVLQSGETPGDFNVVPGMINTVSLYAQGHYPRHKNEDIPATGTPSALHLNLNPVTPGEDGTIPTSKLTIGSSPDGALVLINGRDAGVTPLEANVTTGVEHHVTLRKADHQDHVALVYAWPEDLARIDANLVPNSRKTSDRFTELTIQARDTQITVDSKKVGSSPYFSNRDRNQVLRVELRRSEHHPYRRVVATIVGSISLSPALTKIVREPGQLTIKAVPKDLTIYIGTTEYEPKELKKIELQSGKYPVVLVRPGDPELRFETEIEVEPRALSTYEIDFSGDKASVRRTK